MLALLLFVAPRIRCRLSEWQQARIDGDYLVIRQAKRSNTRAIFVTRRIWLAHLSDRQREAVSVLLDLLPQAIAAYGSYHRWHRASAELLARACESTGFARVAFHAFRHIAIGVWAAAGLAPWQIAAPAGHPSTRTKLRDYGGDASGWEQDTTTLSHAERVGGTETVRCFAGAGAASDVEAFVFEALRAFQAAPKPAPSTPAGWRDHAAAIRSRAESLMRASGDTSASSKRVALGS